MTKYLDYEALLRAKIKIAAPVLPMPDADTIPLHPSLFGHQSATVRWGLRNGRGLIAKSFGLGKTRDQIQLAMTYHEKTGQKVLIVAPLGVKHQFIHEDGPAMGVEWQYVRTDEEIEAATSPFLITNYERVRDGNIDPRKHDFCFVSLDEGSVLRSLGSKTYHVFLEAFRNVPHKFVCTATPSPNNFRELIYYAAWLGVMDVGQALTRWFERDPSKAGNLKLHPQHEKDFWLWVASWALFLFKPSDLGFSDEGYDLPEMRVHWHRVEVDHTRAQKQVDDRGQASLVVAGVRSVQDEARENRETLDARLAKMVEVLEANAGRHAVLWHHYEAERHAIAKARPQAVAVYGSQDLEAREQCILDFAHGKIAEIAPKPEICGSGCNWQRHCDMEVFLGASFKFEDFIQAVHRVYRFGQKNVVDIHIIYAESQENVVAAMKRKWKQHDTLTEKMREIVRTYGLSHAALNSDLKRRIGAVQRQVVTSDRFTAVNFDCVREMANIADNSWHHILTSIPFGNHYEYSIEYEDFGHNMTDAEFFDQLDFLIPHLYRVLKPGRVASIHVKDRILYGHQTASGIMEVSPFCALTLLAFQKHGFLYAGKRTITTDVVRENNSSYRLGWSEAKKDMSKMGAGLNEELLHFRKPPSDVANAYADEMCSHTDEELPLWSWQIDAAGYWRSDGNFLVPSDLYDYEKHVLTLKGMAARNEMSKEFCSLPTPSNTPSVWDDINPMNCLNVKQLRDGRVKHVCPFPLDICKRDILLYSKEGEIVGDPFSGLFSTAYMAVLLGRIGYGIELNGDYFRDGARFCRDAEQKFLAPTLFDVLGIKPEQLQAPLKKAA